MVEAPSPHDMDLISTPYIYKVIDNLHMQWMGICTHHHAITAAHMTAQIWEVYQNPGSLLGAK